MTARPLARLARSLSAAIVAGTLMGHASAAQTVGADQIARGAYLANAGDCVACHTAKGGAAFAGGLMMNTPFGAISTPNITPDKATGIGAWSDEQFYRAMHDGIGHRGEYLYPVMPFPWYTTVTRDDVAAIRAYLNAQPAVHQVRPPNRLSFPFSVRESLLAWRQVFFKPGEFAPDPKLSAEANRGAYLVNGLAHCGECHNARPVAGTSKWRASLQGGVVDNWYAPNITADMRDGIGAWSNDEIARYLKTGVAPGKGIALGPMAETVHSLSRLTDTDLLAIAAYLKTTPPVSNADQKLALFSGRDARGGQTYLDYCASCHGVNGQGLAGVIPALNGNGAVAAKGPQNVIRVVLGGLEARERYAPMPAIGAGMTDAEIADVTNYVRQTWNNAAPPTAMPGMVATLRAVTTTPMTVSRIAACPAVEPALAPALAAPALHAQLAALTDEQLATQTGPLVARTRAAAPRVGQAALVNGLGAAYCEVLRADASLDDAARTLRLGHFSQLVYMAASGRGVR